MRKFYILMAFAMSVFAGCSMQNSGGTSVKNKNPSRINFVCWNTQTFFDAETEGTEYSDFKNSSKWGRDKYLMRLSRLCQVMTTLNPDIMVLEEIENAAVVQDIANQLAGNAWSKKNNWNYATFAKNDGAAIGCAVFSKYPLENLRVHNLDVRTQEDEQPQSRPLMQVDVDVDDKILTIFVNHWKSKSGGERETEIWRDWQELVCEREIEKSINEKGNSCFVCCGDFNRDAKDFVCNFISGDQGEVGNTIFRGAEGEVRLYSPWFNSAGTYSREIGSYYYQGEWERIDNIFAGAQVSIAGFMPKTEGEWAEEKGIPNNFKIFSGEGYSDHLPLMCALILK